MSGAVRGVRTTEIGPQIHWPSCLKCGKVVHAYGMGEDTRSYVDIWAEHHGDTDGLRVLKGPFWGPQSLATVVRRLSFFVPAGEGMRVVRFGFTDSDNR